MNRRYRSLIFFPLLALILALVAPAGLARAQQSISLKTLTIRVWPEFDKPSALVLYEGQVAEGAALPVELRFDMPPTATFLVAAYSNDTTGTLDDSLPNSVEGNQIVLTSPNGSFHVEFYDPIQVSGDQRSYTLTWPGNYRVEQLNWEVEQPVGARDMTVNPTGGSWITDSNGLQAYIASQIELAAGQQATLSVSYAKTGSGLTVDSLPSAPSGAGTPAPVSSSGGISLQTVGIIILIVALLVVLAGGVIYYFNQSKQSKKSRPAPRAAGGGPRFCTKCGQTVTADDKFCRHCGAKLG